MSTASTAAPRFELRFMNLFDPGRGYAFPCDAQGRVALSQLSERARHHYRAARERVGRELATPVVAVRAETTS